MSVAGGGTRVGVTGHRTMADEAGVAARVAAVLDELAAPLTAVSALAEGADRLVAEQVLARSGGRLVALLPLPVDDYARDFTDDRSLRTFNELLASADEVTVAPHDPTDPSREAAYEHAGLALLDHVDVLLALWDGEASRGRGGTAEIVAEARERGIDVRVIPVVRP